MEHTLGKRIVNHRKKLNLTQDQLAEKLGVTAQAVSKWENDQSCPDIAMLPKLAEIFGISIDELLGAEHAPVREAEVIEDAQDEDISGIHVNNGKWEFHFDGGRRNTIGFACWVLLLGVLLLVDNFLQTEIGFWNLAWPSFLVMLGLFGGDKFSFFRLGCVLLGGWFLLDHIGLIPITLDGSIIWPALVILFGISLLADALRKPKHSFVKFHKKGSDNVSREKVSRCDVLNDSFDCENSFGDRNYWISTENLLHGKVENSFGSATLDLSGVKAVADGCCIEAECNFGELKMLVPRRFSVRLDPETAFGSVQTMGDPDPAPEAVLFMNCEANFGSIEIHYI